jgi:glycosyltransferase involved in cell wall biosynthesis
MIRYLEEQAPCIYIPNSDWRHSCVSPKLSDGVAIVGVVHSDDPLHYDHVARLGRYWNAIVTTSQAITKDVAGQQPALSDRLLTIPIGVPVPDHLPKQRSDSSYLRRKELSDLGAGSRAPLRIIYHGGLSQHQKRILDLPLIIEALLKRQVPVELTVVGDGPDRERLLSASQQLIKGGAMRYLGLLPHAEVLELLEEQDVYLLTSEFEGMPNALNEAMGRGCVPVVTDIRSGIPELIHDGVNGYRVPVGDIQMFTERIAFLQSNLPQRREMSLNAYRTIICGGYRTQDMVQRYIELFHRVLDDMTHGTYKRPSGKLLPPPQEVAGIQILPGNYAKEIYETELSLSWKRHLLALTSILRRFGKHRLSQIRTLMGKR